MKSLQTIQKVFHVFYILSKIGMILSFVFAGISALAMLFTLPMYHGGNLWIENFNELFAKYGIESIYQITGALIVSCIVTATDGVLLLYTMRYFKAEEADGTPFTKRGAEQINQLGILNIVIPIAAAIISAIICEIFRIPKSLTADFGNLDSITIGILMLLASLIFRYGAELDGGSEESDIFENFRR